MLKSVRLTLCITIRKCTYRECRMLCKKTCLIWGIFFYALVRGEDCFFEVDERVEEV